MRFHQAEGDQEHDQCEEPDREPNADGKSADGAPLVALVLDQEEQAGGETGDDSEKGHDDDDLDPHLRLFSEQGTTV